NFMIVHIYLYINPLLYVEEHANSSSVLKSSLSSRQSRSSPLKPPLFLAVQESWKDASRIVHFDCTYMAWIRNSYTSIFMASPARWKDLINKMGRDKYTI